MKATNNLEEIDKLNNNIKCSIRDLNIKASDYLIKEIRKFEDKYIEFPYGFGNGNFSFNIPDILQSVEIKTNIWGSDYINLNFVNKYEDEYEKYINDLNYDEVCCLCHMVADYINKYGYKHLEDC